MHNYYGVTTNKSLDEMSDKEYEDLVSQIAASRNKPVEVPKADLPPALPKRKASTLAEWGKVIPRTAIQVASLPTKALGGVAELTGAAMGLAPEENPSYKAIMDFKKEYLDSTYSQKPGEEGMYARNVDWEREHPAQRIAQNVIEGGVPWIAAAAATRGAGLPIVAGLSGLAENTELAHEKGYKGFEAVGKAAIPAATEAGIFALMGPTVRVLKGAYGPVSKEIAVEGTETLMKSVPGKFVNGKIYDALSAGADLLSKNKVTKALMAPVASGMAKGFEGAPGGLLNRMYRGALGEGAFLTAQGEAVQGAQVASGIVSPEEWKQAHSPAAMVESGLTSMLSGAGFGAMGINEARREKVTKELIRREDEIRLEGAKIKRSLKKPTITSESTPISIIPDAQTYEQTVNTEKKVTKLEEEKVDISSKKQEIRKESAVDKSFNAMSLHAKEDYINSIVENIRNLGEESEEARPLVRRFNELMDIYDEQKKRALDIQKNNSLVEQDNKVFSSLLPEEREKLISARYKGLNAEGLSSDEISAFQLHTDSLAARHEELLRIEKEVQPEKTVEKDLTHLDFINEKGNVTIKSIQEKGNYSLEEAQAIKKLYIEKGLINKNGKVLQGEKQPVAEEPLTEPVKKPFNAAEEFEGEQSVDLSFFEGIAKTVKNEKGSAPIAPEYLAKAVYSIKKAVKNFAEFTRELVSRFGEAIRQHALKLWNHAKSIVLNERGSLSEKPVEKSEYSWARRADNSYEVSSKGDKRFSALYAKLKDGRTIEEAYQLDVKGYREKGNDWRLGKGKPPLKKLSRDDQWNQYKNLWKQYLDENPDIEKDLREKAKGKVLTDIFASTDVSQARALAELLNERSTGKPIEKKEYDISKVKIISGGQSGADLAGLDAALDLGMKTGGTAAARYTAYDRTGKKIRTPEYAEKYGLKEGEIVRKNGKFGEYDDVFHARTLKNAQEADGTIWFGNTDSPGARLTLGLQAQKGKPEPLINPETPKDIRNWMEKNNIGTVNIAGNREHTNPGIYESTKSLLKSVFGKVEETKATKVKDLIPAGSKEDDSQKIVRGERTSLIIKKDSRLYDILSQKEVGDIVSLRGRDEDGNDTIVDVKITKKLSDISGSGFTPKDFARTEGRDVNEITKDILPAKDSLAFIRYKFVNERPYEMSKSESAKILKDIGDYKPDIEENIKEQEKILEPVEKEEGVKAPAISEEEKAKNIESENIDLYDRGVFLDKEIKQRIKDEGMSPDQIHNLPLVGENAERVLNRLRIRSTNEKADKKDRESMRDLIDFIQADPRINITDKDGNIIVFPYDAGYDETPAGRSIRILQKLHDDYTAESLNAEFKIIGTKGEQADYPDRLAEVFREAYPEERMNEELALNEFAEKHSGYDLYDAIFVHDRIMAKEPYAKKSKDTVSTIKPKPEKNIDSRKLLEKTNEREYEIFNREYNEEIKVVDNIDNIFKALNIARKNAFETGGGIDYYTLAKDSGLYKKEIDNAKTAEEKLQYELLGVRAVRRVLRKLNNVKVGTEKYKLFATPDKYSETEIIGEDRIDGKVNPYGDFSISELVDLDHQKGAMRPDGKDFDVSIAQEIERRFIDAGRFVPDVTDVTNINKRNDGNQYVVRISGKGEKYKYQVLSGKALKSLSKDKNIVVTVVENLGLRSTSKSTWWENQVRGIIDYARINDLATDKELRNAEYALKHALEKTEELRRKSAAKKGEEYVPIEGLAYHTDRISQYLTPIQIKVARDIANKSFFYKPDGTIDKTPFKTMSKELEGRGYKISPENLHRIYADMDGDVALFRSKLERVLKESDQSTIDNIFSGAELIQIKKARQELIDRMELTDNQKKVLQGLSEATKEELTEDFVRLKNLTDRLNSKNSVGEMKESKTTSFATEKLRLQLPVRVEDVFVPERGFEGYRSPFGIPGVRPGKLRNEFAQKMFEKIANVFDAELVVVGGNKDFDGVYIPQKEGKSKLVINAETPYGFTRMFAHELFHHTINKAIGADPILYKVFDDALMSHMNEAVFDKIFNKIVSKNYPQYIKNLPKDYEIETGDLWNQRAFAVSSVFNYTLDQQLRTRNAREAFRPVEQNVLGSTKFTGTTMPDLRIPFAREDTSVKFPGKGIAERPVVDKRSVIAKGMERLYEVPDHIRESIRQEIYSELFAHSFTRHEFWKALSNHPKGWSLGQKILISVAEKTTKLIDVLNSLGPQKSMYEIHSLIDGWNMRVPSDITKMNERQIAAYEEVQSVMELLSDVFVAASESKRLGNLDTKFAKGGTQRERDFVGAINRILPEGSSTKKRVMTAIEELLAKGKDLVLKHKPKQFYAHLNTSSESKDVAYFMRHAGNEERTKVMIEFEKDSRIFEKMALPELIALHERVVRSGDRNTLDKLPEDIKNFFVRAEKIANEYHEKLLKYYPDLPKRATHYGQSIKWYRDNILDRDEFEFDLYSNKSKLTGDDRFLEYKSQKHTKDIMDSGLRFKTINPVDLLANYVADVAKLIAVHEGTKKALENKTARIFTDPIVARNRGYVAVDDTTFKIMQDMNISAGYKIKLNNGEYLKFDGHEALFSTKEEAQWALESGKDLFGTIESVKPEKLRKITNYYVLNKDKVVPKDFLTEKDALDYINSQETPSDFTIEPKFSQKTMDDAVMAKIYFKPDLARMLNIMMSKDRLRSGRIAGVSGNTIADVKNSYTTFELGLSLFHMLTISQELTSSYSSYRLGRDGFSKGVVPIANLVQAKRENKKINDLFEKTLLDPSYAKSEEASKIMGEVFGNSSTDMLDIIQQFHNQGGIMYQDRSLRSSFMQTGKMHYYDEEGSLSLKAMSDSIKQYYQNEVKAFDYLNPDAKYKFAPTLQTVRFAATRGVTDWLMEEAIPKIKFAQFAREYSLKVLQNREGIEAGLVKKEDLARDTLRFVEDRFGEVNWDNLWMNKSFKTALQLAFRSYTWFTGSWAALGKSGIDIAKLGWFKLKGEEYHMTEKGLWGITAMAAHIMTAAAITAIYKGINLGNEEEPDDPNLGMLERLMFPRVDPYDNTKRLSIPSYPTEFYKIFSHLGGKEFDPFALIKGRFNGLVSRATELATNEDWQGVPIFDPNDSIYGNAKYLVKTIMPIPISMSTIAKDIKDKGLNLESAENIVTGGMGFVNAPAYARRSEAVNTAYNVSRREYKGRETPHDIIEERGELKRAMYQLSKGNRKDIERLVSEGKISTEQYKNSLKRIPLINNKPNPRYVPELTRVLNRLTFEGSYTVWKDMTDLEKKQQFKLIAKKFRNLTARDVQSPNRKAKALSLFNKMKKEYFALTEE